MPPTAVVVVGGLLGGLALLALSHVWIVVLSAAVGAVLFGAGINAGGGWILLFFVLGVAVQYGLIKLGQESEERALEPAASEKSLQPTPPVPAQQVAPPKAPENPIQVGPVKAVTAGTADAGVQAVAPRLRARVTLVSGDGARYTIVDGSLVGRSRSCDVRLSDPAVSRRHFRVRHAQGAWFLQDVGSTGGTFVNGRRVEAVRLNPGDRIQIGSSTFTFYPEDVQ